MHEEESHITNLQSKCSLLEERCSSFAKTLETVRQESSDWKRKYENVISKLKDVEEHASAEVAALKSRTSAVEARLSAAREQVESAQEEAEEWKRKYGIAVHEAKTALEKAAMAQERGTKNMQQREDALKTEFASSLAKKALTHSNHQCYILLTHTRRETERDIHSKPDEYRCPRYGCEKLGKPTGVQQNVKDTTNG